MGQNYNKNKKKRLKKKRNQNKIKKMEREDSLGISRKEIKGLNEKIFIILKIISIILIPLIYFIYSPFLIFAVIFSFSMFIFASLAERKINHTFIKSNHMKISKLDSIIAFVVILITITGSIINSNTKKKMSNDNLLIEFKHTVTNIGSCLTGNRSIIKNIGMGMHFGTKDFDPSSMPKEPPKGGRPPEDFSIEDLPLDILFSHMISSINSVLIFIIPLSGALTLFIYYKKKKKFNYEMNLKINDDCKEIKEEDLKKLLSFGYLKDEFGNFIIDDEIVDDIKLEINTPYVETLIVDEFIDEFTDSDNI